MASGFVGMWRHGVTDAMAEVILIAAVIAIVVGVFAWITGVWSGEASSAAERVFIFPDSKVFVDSSSGNVWFEMHVSSDIKPSVEIYKVELLGVVGQASSIINIIQGGPVTITPSGSIIIPAGTEAWIRIDFPGLNPINVNPVYGGKIEVLIYTNTGYVYKAMATIEYQ